MSAQRGEQRPRSDAIQWSQTLYENRISDFEEKIARILAQLAHYMHPAVVARIQDRNEEERPIFEKLFRETISASSYLFPGSACVFPGVRRWVNGQGAKRKFNPRYSAILDDNIFPRHLWCFVAGGRPYSGPSWKSLRLAEFELAHVFSHKANELTTEAAFFEDFDHGLLPLGDFSCACNTVLLPKGTVRPTDNSATLKGIFYRRYVELYGERPLQGRSGFLRERVPSWYDSLLWNEPRLHRDWKSRVDSLLDYRTRTIARILADQPSADPEVSRQE